MTDTALLKEKVEESGLKSKFIYEKLGISKGSWYNKLKGRSPFKAYEIETLCTLLHISSLKEKRQIFFADM